ncbi:hypothetical protein DFQ28_009521 [Apophysomyces sp. BC1034]|nr:hypothetical protein DFQ28_009521 [Apophysomyces sp. BC1034]
MPCVARQRKCMYVNNSDDTYIKLDPLSSSDSLQQDVGSDLDYQRTHTNSESLYAVEDSVETLFSETNTAHTLHDQHGVHNSDHTASTRPDKMIEQLTDGLMRLTLHQDGSRFKPENVTPWSNYGDFVRWSPEPALLRSYSTVIEMPSRQTQELLIDVFFNRCRHVFPIWSRRMFYDQLSVKSSLITPLMLNIMYAHASKHVDNPEFRSQPDNPKTQGDVFYNRARKLIDDFLDTPRLSTVIALLYMVSYGGSHNQGKTEVSRSWMYSGMAVRMCLDLGLNTGNYSSQLSQFDIELRKRVLWACYVMDKLESCIRERPWMLGRNDISLDMPASLPEDSRQEKVVLEGFARLCDLMIILERVIHFFTYEISRRDPWTADKEKCVFQFLKDIHQWSDALPEHLCWTPALETGKQELLFLAVSANLNLFYYILELSLLLCCHPHDNHLHLERRRLLASTITNIVSFMIQNQRLVYSTTLTVFAGVFAAFNHVTNFKYPDTQAAGGSKAQFRVCLRNVRMIVERFPMCDMNNLTHLLDVALQPQAFDTYKLSPTMDMYSNESHETFMYEDRCQSVFPNPMPATQPIKQPASTTMELEETVEPADYTFGLISMSDEWSQSLGYLQ